MKIGLSFSRCVRDIAEGVVDINDVLVIISRTDFDPRNDEHWASIWEGYLYGGYSYPEWAGNEDKEETFRAISIKLLETGRLHQPRQFGHRPVHRMGVWLDVILPVTELEKNPAAKDAWETFQTVAGLSNIEIKGY